MKIEKGLLYAKSHEWARFIDETTAVIGLSDYAQQALGGIVFISLPSVGDEVVCETRLGDVESVKSVSDIISPVSGTVSKVNEEVINNPEQINDSPYDSWLIEVENITDKAKLLSAEDYERFCEEDEH